MKFVITIDTSESKKITQEQAQVIFEDISLMLEGFMDPTTYDTLMDMQKLRINETIKEIHGSTEYPYYGVNIKSVVDTQTNAQVIR